VTATTDAPGAWAPLRLPAFRALWLAVLFSNIGTWMQTVGAQWLLVDQPNAATLVALVQTATTLPVVLLALPAGALADTLDRRRLLLGVQLGLTAAGVVLTALTWLGRISPPVLLALTFTFGVGQALTAPTWQAIIPELVPREQIPAASALGSISVNGARSVGPAIAGLIVAQAGPAAVFAVNAASFLVFALVLLRSSFTEERQGVPERFVPAVRAGGRYVRFSPVVRRILLRIALFVLPASALWALLPLVASRRLGLGAGGYGLLLGAVGLGAVLGAVLLSDIRARLSADQQLLLAGLTYGAALIVLALSRITVLSLAVLLVAGMGWMVVISTVNASLQLFLPRWVRARGLATYQIVFAGGQAFGALVWGAVAQVAGLPAALLAAGALLLAGAAATAVWPLHDTGGRDPASVSYWPEPHLALEPDPSAGPVLVSLAYRVPPERQVDFVTAMQKVRRSRRRTGAIRWGLFRDAADSSRMVEFYVVDSWDEHRRQHDGRLTATDQEVERLAHAFTEGEPEVTHLLPPD
jgi:MFS family permease